MQVYKKIFNKISSKLKKNSLTVGTWMQTSDPNTGLILSKNKFDWVAVDMEHGNIPSSSLPIIFRSILLGGSLPMARLCNHEKSTICKTLDDGAFGLILPNIEEYKQIKLIIDHASYPPYGTRGSGFSAANNFGSDFENYFKFFKKPIIIAMIETKKAVENLEKIIECKGLDGILIGPYDLSASLKSIGNFKSKIFLKNKEKILKICKRKKISVGMHQVAPNIKDFKKLKKEGYNFIPYGMDTTFLTNINPLKQK